MKRIGEEMEEEISCALSLILIILGILLNFCALCIRIN